jgi:hypothetical protein
LEQVQQDDPHEEAKKEPDAAPHARGLEDLTDAGEPVDEREHPGTLNDHAHREDREGKRGQAHGLPSTEPPDALPAGGLPGALATAGDGRSGLLP